MTYPFPNFNDYAVSLGMEKWFHPTLYDYVHTYSCLDSSWSVLVKGTPACKKIFQDIIQYQHYSDIISGAMASQITSLTIVYSTLYSGADQRKHQSSASLAFVRGSHRWPVNSPHKWPVTRKMFLSIWWRHHDLSSLGQWLPCFDGWLQKRCNSIANSLEFRLSCTNPSVCFEEISSCSFFILFCFKCWWFYSAYPVLMKIMTLTSRHILTITPRFWYCISNKVEYRQVSNIRCTLVGN